MKIKFPLSSFLLLLLLFPAYHGFSQSISEKFDGVKVSFDITTTDTIILNDNHQFLLRRAESNSEYGYQSIHLEFKSKQAIENTGRSGTGGYRMTFYDGQKKEIAVVRLGLSFVKPKGRWDANTFIYYSVDLKNIPLLILDRTVKIDIIQQGY